MWLTVGSNVIIDHLNISVPTGIQRDRCVSVEGSNIQIGAITVTSVDTQATTETNDCGVRILNSSNFNIGRISTTKYDRAILIGSSSNGVIGDVVVTNYTRGLYIYDCSNVVVEQGNITGTSPNTGLTAGYNGVILSSNTTDAQKNITLNNITITDTGEHGVRVGGDFQQTNIYLNNFRIRGHGGCGIKVLGTDTTAPTARNKNIFINNPIIEDGGTSASAFNNRCGILVQFADGVQINNPIIKPKNNSSPASVGIRIDSCTEVMITNPIIISPAKQCIQIHAENANVENVQVLGGLGQAAGTDALAIICDSTRTIRRVVVDGFNCETATNYGFNITNSGSFIDLLCRLKLYSNTAGAGACNSTAVTFDNYGLPGSTALSGISANNGSRWSDGTTFNYRKAGTWVAL